ncbi:MAG: VCBS repeat-containing protein [Nanoarchaeota archaeon]
MGRRGAYLFSIGFIALGVLFLVLFQANFVISKDQVGIVKNKEIKNLDDTNALTKFSYLKGYKNIVFDISSSKDFNTENIQKTNGEHGSTFKFNNLEVKSDYRQHDTSLFNTKEKPVKQTYFIKNLLAESRTVKLNVRYEIDSSTVIWNGTNYTLSTVPTYFRAFENKRDASSTDEETYLDGNVIYFGNNYYDFKDILNFDYKVSVYSKENRNYIDLELNVDLAQLQELAIDPELGWTTHVIGSSADWATGLYTADIDKDGDLDVVSSSENDKKIAWYENNGSTWIERSIATSFLSPKAVFAADINNDTYIDVVSVSHTGVDNGQVIWYQNNGSSPPGWTNRTVSNLGPPYSPRTVIVADLDKDGRMDIIVGESLGLGEIYFIKNNGGSPPTWTENVLVSSVGEIRSLYAIDMDKDNDTDVISASRDNDKIEWYQNNGGSPLTWTTRTINTTADDARSVYATDLDSDGDMDVLSASRNDDKVAWYENNGSIPAGWTGRIINTSADGAVAVSAADFDGDGDVDVVSGSDNDFKISWYENSGSSLNWTRKTITSTGNGVSFLQSVDLNGDEAIDVVGARGFTDFVEWYENNGSGNINSMRLAQVIENTELVKDRKTLVRTEINASSNSQVLVSLYFDNVLKNSTTAIFNATETMKTIDFYFKPDVAGNNKEVKVAVFGGVAKKVVNVSATRNLSVTFVSVDNAGNFDNVASDSIDFIKKTYPLSDTGLIAKTNRTGIQSNIAERAPYGVGFPLLMHRVYRSTLIAGELPERAVGIVPFHWFADNIFGDQGTHGVSSMFNNGVLVEADLEDYNVLDHVAAHELGHTYGFCDEYDSDEWSSQNSFLGFTDLCPNGDANNDEILDAGCAPDGCPASTLSPLTVDPLYTDPLSNFMGNLLVTKRNWISDESYEHLLQEFKHATPISTTSRIVVSGIINGSSDTGRFENFYTVGAGLAINQTEYQTGNYTIEAYNSTNGLVYNFSFDVSFTYFLLGSNSTQINETAFAFTIPFNQSFSKFILKKDGVTKDTRNVSAHVPALTLTSYPGSQIFSNQELTINWTASDSDGDTLSYAILVSPDNGTTYSTVALDLNQTSYSINSSDLPDGTTYKIKVLASDGANTNSSAMTNTFGVDNDLQIVNFKEVYTNSTERVFLVELNNTANFNIANITWQFDSGEDIKDSTLLFHLQPAEAIFVYIYHNYSTSGSYNATFLATSSNYIEMDRIGVTI